MNSLPYAQATLHGQYPQHCRVLDSEAHEAPCPPNVHDQNAPVFMNPLLPPQPVQAAWQNPPPLSTAGPSTPAPGHFFSPSRVYNPGARPPPRHQRAQFQSQEHSSHDPNNPDKGYDLEFPTLEAFHHWRSELEHQESVEFIKVGTKPSSLVCSRHTKSVRDKYVGPFPGGHPSRKSDAGSCPASISFWTYDGSQIVRAKYFSHHSHPIGQENLPFTRRGRKLADHERGTQQNPAFSLENGVFTGSTPNAVTQGNILSKDREAPVRNSCPDPLRIEPPPMACLKPPEQSAGYSAHENNGNCSSLVQNHSGPVPPRETPPSELSPPRQRACDVRDRTYDKSLAYRPSTSDNGRATSYSESLAPPSLDASVHQPQPSYMPQTHVLSYQSQYLPTPTTPSAQIQQPRPPNPCHTADSAPFCRRLGQPQGHARILPTTNRNSTHPSPISPVTPNTLPLAAPALDGQLNVLQHSSPAQEAMPFNEDRWNHLETLFQAVRLRARSYVPPEPAICMLENLLRQLYADGQQGYMRPEGDRVYGNRATYSQSQ